MKQSRNPLNLDDVFKDRLKDFEAEPSDLSWIGIETQLPTGSFLAAPLRVIAGVAASVAVVTFGVIAGTQLNEATRSGLAANEAPAVNSSQLTRPLLSATPEVLPAADFTVASFVQPTTTSNFVASTRNERRELVSAEALDRNEAEPISLGDQAAPLTQVRHVKPISVDEATKGFHVGVQAGANNTWLFTPTQHNGTVAEYQPAMGGSYGISAGYDFSSRAGVEVSVIASSSEGQNYSVVTEAGPVRANAKVNYTRIPVVYKHRFAKHSGLLNTTVSTNYLIGLQYGRLNWVNVDQELAFIEQDDFNQQELGVTIGAEMDIYFAKNYMLTVGARAAVNNEASAFPFFMSNEYAETANFSAGLNLKLSYLFNEGS